MAFTFRKHEVVAVEDFDDVSLDRIPYAVMCFQENSWFDVGAFCYQGKKERTPGQRYPAILVDESTLSKARSVPVSRIGQWFSQSQGRLARDGLQATAQLFKKAMMWFDENGYPDALTSSQVAEQALENYFSVISEKGKLKELNVRWARRTQLAALKMIQVAHADIRIGQTLKVLWAGNRAEVSNDNDADAKQSDREPSDSRPQKWGERRHILVAADQIDGVQNDDVPALVIQLSDGATIDVGAFCFTSRHAGVRHGSRVARLVQESTFDARRVLPVKAMAKHICDQLALAGVRESTMLPTAGMYFAFLDFCEVEGFDEALFNKVQADAALKRYCASIYERWKQRKFKSRHARRLQRIACELMSAIYEDDEMGYGLVTVTTSDSGVTNTPVPDEGAQGKVLALCQALFDGFFQLCCEGAHYPYRLELPKYLPWPRHYIWIFAKKNWSNDYVVPGRSADEGVGHAAYDYQNGNIRSQAEAELFCEPSNAKELIAKAYERQNSANNNLRDPTRMRAAAVAHNVFFLLFLFNVGANFSDIREYLWTGEYDVEGERQNFRTIKWRAGGKQCKFEIEAGFFPMFKRFLEVRKFMLGGQDCKCLFVSLGRSENDVPHKVGQTFVAAIYKTLRLIDPDLQAVTPREIRAAKANFLISNTDVGTSAAVLQNTPETLLKSYTAGSETTHLAEMTSYFEALSEAVVVILQHGESATDTPAGKCRGIGNAMPIDGVIPIAVDCDKQEGCMFCVSYRVHADREDARKILSCMQYIQFVTVLARSKEEIDLVFEKVFARAEEVLSLIEQHSPGTVDKVREEVEEGNLSPYWQAKIEMLRNCGVI